MLLLSRSCLNRSFFSFGCTILIGAGLAHAQASDSVATPSGWSSSKDGGIRIAEGSAPASAALPSAPAPAGSAAAQNDHGRYGRYGNRDLVHHMAFEVGGGFNAPTESKGGNITWGGQFTAGAGVNFNEYFALMAEYQFIHDKLPGTIISEAGATGGYANIWSLTLDPVVDLFPKSSNDLYLTGGGGFYRKVTSFTDPQLAYFCDYYYGYCGVTTQNAVVGHFSSNQGGVNIGMGYQHRFGGMYGEGHAKFFAEARYLDVLSPAVVGITPSGLGVTTVSADTTLIPVTVGLRF